MKIEANLTSIVGFNFVNLVFIMLSLVSRVITSAYNRSVPGGQTATSGVAMEETKQWLIQTDLLGPWMPAEIVALGTVFFSTFLLTYTFLLPFLLLRQYTSDFSC